MSQAMQNLINNFEKRFKHREGDDSMLLQVAKALPQSPQEQWLLLHEFTQRPDDRFSSESVLALGAYVREKKTHATSFTLTQWQWRALVHHPDQFSKAQQGQLDRIQQEFPPVQQEFDAWIRAAVQYGFLEKDQQACYL